MPLGEQVFYGSAFEGPPLARDLRWIIVMGGVAVFISWREGIRSGLVLWMGTSSALLAFMHLNSHFARRRVAGVVRYPLCALAGVMVIAIVTLADHLVLGP